MGYFLAGILAGWGEYLRDVTLSGNVIRGAPTGIVVSVAEKAGAAIVSGNLISGAKVGIRPDRHGQAAGGDLVKGAGGYAQLTIEGNRLEK